MRKQILMLVSLCILALPIQALADDDSDARSVKYGTVYYDKNDPSCAETDLGTGSLPDFIPEKYNSAVTAAGKKFNVSPALLAGLFVEENFTGIDPDKIPDKKNSWPNPDGPWARGGANGTYWPDGSDRARGPFQFEPGTWEGYGYDGDNNGTKDPDNLIDAAFAAANYAKANGATLDKPVESWRNFIFNYNRADWYVDAVMSYYRFIKDKMGDVSPSNPTSVTDPGSACSAGGGVGVGTDGFVFPQKTTKSDLKKMKPYAWSPTCVDPISEMGPGTSHPESKHSGLCHHDYLAADIFNETGTPVVAPRPGRVVTYHDGGAVGWTIRIYSDKSLGGDGLWYYMAHMRKPSEGGKLYVHEGQTVKAGDQVGQVGTDKDAENTERHTHIDVSPVDNGFHRGYDGTAGPLLSVMPALKASYDALPD